MNMTYKILISSLFILLSSSYCYSKHVNNIYKHDTTIIKMWFEKGVKYKLEIKIRNAADSFGIIPGQDIESFIEIKKSYVRRNRTYLIAYKKDSCNAQTQQLVFFEKCVQFKDLNNDGTKEFVLLYEFGFDGFDDRTVYYILIDKKKIHITKILLRYSEEKMEYTVITSLTNFIASLPANFKKNGKTEFYRGIKCMTNPRFR